ncbi:MAG: TerC/Alx family metal homeostasis membrane protein, partial [Mycetocola sp.]
NLFVFIVIMTTMSVPRKYQQEVLMVGIIIALILRGIFILAGAAVIERFSWIFYIFGAFLLYTAWKQAFGSGDEGEGDSKVTAFLRRRLNVSDEFDGNKLRTTIGGKRYWTPMLLVFITIGATDFLFAIDSIPAIFGITQSPFIVFTANVFALMGLRQLYFLLGGLLEKLIYLHYGIAFILGFIGVKLVLHALEVNELGFINGGQPVPVPHIDTMMSLVVIIGSMAVATVASLIVSRRRAARDAAVTAGEGSDGSSTEA